MEEYENYDALQERARRLVERWEAEEREQHEPAAEELTREPAAGASEPLPPPDPTRP